LRLNFIDERLLACALGDPETVLDEARDYVVERPGTAGGVLIVDETGGSQEGHVTSETRPAWRIRPYHAPFIRAG
jgi:hypothetical protein